jgi:DNA polymerase-4
MAVGGERRGIIASASYEARKRGVYTPMPSARAREVCPELVIVHGDFAKYRRYSTRMFDLAEDYTPEVERTSIDEGYFDLGSNPRIEPRKAAVQLQQRIATELGITVSLGIGANKLISQIASKLRKPNALVEVPRGTEREFIAPLECHWLPGVGPKFAARLRAAGLRHVHQIADAPLALLAQLAGNYASTLQSYALGIDERRVIREPDDAKSYGAQETFSENVADTEVVLGTLRDMADALMSKVRRDDKAIRTVTVRVRYRDMSDVSHAVSLKAATDLETDVYPLLPRLLRETWKRERGSLRLVGLRFSNIGLPFVQTELSFDQLHASRDRQRDAARLLDQMRARSLPLTRGHALRRRAS